MPEELRYLRDVCRLLRDLGVHARQERDALFDRDELGIDPEDDYEEYD